MARDVPVAMLLAATAAACVAGFFLGRAGRVAFRVPPSNSIPPQQPVTNKVVVVTGGSRGIGRDICLLLAAQGYKVAVNYANSAEKAKAVVAQIERAGGVAVAIQADVGKEEDVARLFLEAERSLGAITHLVNNAGIIGKREAALLKDKADVLVPDLLEVFQTNVIGTMLCTQQAAARMSTQYGGYGGVIVNISSGAAFIGAPFHYSISKGALNSFQSASVKELAAHGIRMNSVSPGLTRTEMITAEMERSGMPSIPMKRVGEPYEIAAVVAFLLSNDASYCTGANIRVAGGRQMGGVQ